MPARRHVLRERRVLANLRPAMLGGFVCLAGALLACGGGESAASTATRSAPTATRIVTQSDAAAAAEAAASACSVVLRSGQPGPIFVCIDEPLDGAHISGSIKLSGKAASPTKSDVVVTLTDASGNSAVLIGLPPPAAATTPWGTTVQLPPNTAVGAAKLTVYIANAQGGGSLATRRLWIDAPGPRS